MRSFLRKVAAALTGVSSPPIDYEAWFKGKLEEFAPSSASEPSTLLSIQTTLATVPSYLAHEKDIYFYGRQFAASEVPALRKTVTAQVEARLASVRARLNQLAEQWALDSNPASARQLAALPVSVWLRLLEHESPTIRSVARQNPPPVPELVPTALRMLKEAGATDVSGALELLVAVGHFDRPAAEASVLGLLARPQLPAATRLAGIRSLVRIVPSRRSDFVEAPLEERLAVVEALNGQPEVMDFLLDDDPTVVAKARGALEAAVVENLVERAVQTMKLGKAAEKQAAVLAVEPLLSRHRRVLFDPLRDLVVKGSGDSKRSAARAMATLARTQRLPNQQLEAIAEVLSQANLELETMTFIKNRISGATPSEEPIDDIEARLEEGASENMWAVYGDALLASGDVRGELVAVSHKGADLAPLIERHRTQLFGAELVQLLGTEFREFLESLTWRHGFIEKATIASLSEEFSIEKALPLVLTAPAARFLSKLELGLTTHEAYENDYAELIELVADSAGAHLIRALFLGAFELGAEMEISWAPWGDVSAVWKAIPNLKELRLRGSGGRLGPIDAAFLETLVIESGGLPLEVFDAVVEARLPGLSKLEVWFGNEAYGAECTSSDVQRLLARPDTQLRSLGLRNANFTHELIPLLAKWKPLSSLRRLDLSLGVLSDADVDVLLEHRAAFAHLEALDLRENVMVMRMTEVERALPNALVGDQRDTDGERYVAVGE
ncbi:MAG: hypothetical protein Q8S33_00250 [Myxococcales bacterium]|nr:hypothetical protein [Myxococcales bacterium]